MDAAGACRRGGVLALFHFRVHIDAQGRVELDSGRGLRAILFLAKAGPALASHSPALQLTLKPTAVDSDSPYLIQVYVKSVCDNAAKGPGELLGVVSFFPAKVDQPQEFVLTPPEKGFPSVAPRNVLVTVQLIPANPSRALVNVSVEVISARFAE
jgi:hypothetical protein